MMETTGRDSPRGRCSLRPLSSTRTSGRRAPAADIVNDIDIVGDIDIVDVDTWTSHGSKMLLATWRPTSPSLAPMSAGSGIRGAGVVVVVVVEVARLRICVREEIALLIVSRSKLGSDGNWGAAVGDNYIYNIYTGLLKMCVCIYIISLYICHHLQITVSVLIPLLLLCRGTEEAIVTNTIITSEVLIIFIMLLVNSLLLSQTILG